MTAKTKPRVDYYQVSWRGPERHPELNSKGRKHPYAGKLVYHEKQFRPAHLKTAQALAKSMAGEAGVEEVTLRSAEVWNDLPGFPMAMMSDKLPF